MTATAATPVLVRLAEEARALQQAGRLAEAEQAYTRIVTTNPQYADGWFLFGTLALQTGRHADAVARLEKAVGLNRRSVAYLFNLALAHQGAGQLDQAVDAFRKVVRLDAKVPEAHNSLGAVLQAQGKRGEAIAAFRRAIALRADYARGHYNLGTALKDEGQFAASAESLRTAIGLEPGLSQAHANLGVVLQELGDVAGARAAYERTLTLNPAEPETLNNFATLLRDAGDLAGAEVLFAKAIAARPTFAEAHRNTALLHLLQGNFAAGWTEYRWRWQCPDLAPSRRPFAQPAWDGESHAGNTVLVWGEQGVGDEILYASMMDDAARRSGGPLLWEADPRLANLFQRSHPTVQVLPRANPPDPRTLAAAAQIPAADLGAYVRVQASDLPARCAYLQADPARAAALRDQINLRSGERLVGVSWVSHNPVFGTHKSTRLVEWAPVLRQPGVRFVDLQYGDTQADRAAAALSLTHLDDLDLRDDLDGVAALMTACDLVITVSNTCAHLAGALGRPVWVLVPAGGGKLWYWGQRENRTPWYPSATLFRQTTADDWATPLGAVAQELQQFLA